MRLRLHIGYTSSRVAGAEKHREQSDATEFSIVSSLVFAQPLEPADRRRSQSQFSDRSLRMDKRPFITNALQRLAADLGAHAFVIADHWKDDDAASAIASPRNTSQLIYFCQSDLGDDTLFDYELETAPLNSNDRIYDVAGRGSRVTYEELREMASKHLEAASS